jgi:hypothetical protein
MATPTADQRLAAAVTLVTSDRAQIELVARVLLYQVNARTPRQSPTVQSINFSLGNYFGIADPLLRQMAGRVAQYGTPRFVAQRYFNLESRFAISDCLDLPPFRDISGPYRATLYGVSPYSGRIISSIALTFQLRNMQIDRKLSATRRDV